MTRPRAALLFLAIFAFAFAIVTYMRVPQFVPDQLEVDRP